MPNIKPSSKTYALAALKDRRATIAGQIKKLEDAIAGRREQLMHLDATLQILEPGFDTDNAPVKRFRRVHLFGQGELSRDVLDVLRRAGKPITTEQAIADFMALKDLGPESRTAVAHRVRANLAYQVRHKQLVTKTGERRKARWALRA